MTNRSADRGSQDSHEYEAPKLYESSDLLSKYRTPAPDAPADDLLDDAVDEFGASTDAGDATDAAEGYTISLPTPVPADVPSAIAERHALLTDVATVANTIDIRGAGIGAAPGERVGDAMSRYQAATHLRRSSQTPGGGTTMRPTYPIGSKRATGDTERRGIRHAAGDAGGTPKKASNVGIYFGVAAIVAAFIGVPWFVWPVSVILVIVGVMQLRKAGSRVRGVLAVVMAAVAMVVAVANPIALFDGVDMPSPLSGDVLDVNGTASVSGSGDARLDIVLPDGPTTPAILQVEVTGDDFRVFEIDDAGEASFSSSYSAYSEGTGRGVINGDPELETATLSIEAEGGWTVTLESVETLPTFTDTYSGARDDIIFYTGDAGDMTFTTTPDDSFRVTTHGQDDWDMNINGVSSVTRPLPAGPVVIEIESYEQWSISVQPDGGASTGSQPSPGGDDASVAPTPDDETTS